MTDTFTVEQQQLLDRLTVAHAGRYVAEIPWAIRHGITDAHSIAGIVEDRYAGVLRHMIGTPGHWRDRDDWWPLLIDACQAMLTDMADAGAIAAA